MLKKIVSLSITVVLFFTILSGCSIGGMGKKNSDFEYIKQGKISKVNINSTRDKGFKFVVTDEKEIKDIYDILSSAKQVNTKSSLQPDYVFQFYTQEDKVYTFNYVSGVDNDDGNFYSDDKIYHTSKKIDSDVISSFWYIRRPKDFKNVYYNSLLNALDKYRKDVNKNDLIGMDIKDDVDIAKFILSIDEEDFLKDVNNKSYNANIFDGDSSSYSIVMSVKTEGYKTDTLTDTGTYKCTVTFQNKKDNSMKIYYILDSYKNSKWNIKIYADKSPADF